VFGGALLNLNCRREVVVLIDRVGGNIPKENNFGLIFGFCQLLWRMFLNVFL